jgi:hypothetical protein
VVKEHVTVESFGLSGIQVCTMLPVIAAPVGLPASAYEHIDIDPEQVEKPASVPSSALRCQFAGMIDAPPTTKSRSVSLVHTPPGTLHVPKWMVAHDGMVTWHDACDVSGWFVQLTLPHCVVAVCGGEGGVGGGAGGGGDASAPGGGGGRVKTHVSVPPHEAPLLKHVPATSNEVTVPAEFVYSTYEQVPQTVEL